MILYNGDAVDTSASYKAMVAKCSIHKLILLQVFKIKLISVLPEKGTSLLDLLI